MGSLRAMRPPRPLAHHCQSLQRQRHDEAWPIAGLDLPRVMRPQSAHGRHCETAGLAEGR